MGRIGTRPASPRRNHRHRLTGGTRMNATTTEQLWFLDTLTIVRVPHDQGRDGISVLDRLPPFRAPPPPPVRRPPAAACPPRRGRDVLRARGRAADPGRRRRHPDRLGRGGARSPRRAAHLYRPGPPGGGL